MPSTSTAARCRQKMWQFRLPVERTLTGLDNAAVNHLLREMVEYVTHAENRKLKHWVVARIYSPAQWFRRSPSVSMSSSMRMG